MEGHGSKLAELSKFGSILDNTEVVVVTSNSHLCGGRLISLQLY